jgi:hypothetical protein
MSMKHEVPRANMRVVVRRIRGELKNESISNGPWYTRFIENPTRGRGVEVRETHAMLKNIQIIHLAQLGPNILHGHLEPGITVYRIMYGQNVYVTMNADGSSAHYRTEEGDLAFCAVEEIP